MTQDQCTKCGQSGHTADECTTYDDARVMCGCGDQYPMNSYEAGFIEGRGHCENCAAMSGDGVVRLAR